MRFSTICSFLVIAGWASASPIRTRQTPTHVIDPGISFLLVLEEIATTYFAELLETFSDEDFEAAGFSSTIRDDIIATIASNENDHFTVLQSIVGSPPPNCTVDFTSAFTDVATALQSAREVDTLSVASYIGHIANDPESDNLELFAEILANEGQHKLMLDFSIAGQVATHAFELGLNPAELLAILAPFNPSCTPALPVTPNTPLVITNNGSITTDTILTFDLSGTSCTNQPGLSCQILNGNDATATPLPIDQCSMAGQAGATYIFITTDDFAISSDPIDRVNVPSLCVGPALVLIDS